MVWEVGEGMLLSDSVQYLKGIGEKRSELFHKLGVFTVHDLLHHLPRGFEDRTQIKDIADLIDGESVCVKGYLTMGVRNFNARNRTRIVQTRVSDGSGIMQLTWFNAPYVVKVLEDQTQEYIFFGRVTYRGMNAEMVNPIIEKIGATTTKMGKIIPIYPSVAGLGQQNIRDAITSALEKLSEKLPETLSESIRFNNNLVGIDKAIHDVHIPTEYDDFLMARHRLVFEEFLILQLGVSTVKIKKRRENAVSINDVKCISEFASSLSFDLTRAQKRVINEIAADLKKTSPMNRLIQGDVGSGKTIVAAAAMFAVAKSGYQSVMMAPTEILAEQHYSNLKKYFEPWGIKVAFLTGGQKAKERHENAELIESGEASIIVGTHAVITDKVNFSNLVLTITDEQHRFGVNQRVKLATQGLNAHTLVMTATPIPRTLSLVIYGDLDVSIIDELPPGRKPILTMAVSENKRQRAYDFVLNEINKGRQIYFVCALVDESDVVNAKAATEYVKNLSQGMLRGKSVGLIHGKMKSFEKEDIMRRFGNGDIDALVATTVIEVGVDVPNATIMVIENAERFGLSQLHQLRGRVGRGAEQSYCIMFGNQDSGVASERMKVMCETNDGFKISERDLHLRGPGEFFGTRQHGLPEMKIGNFFTDMDILKETQDIAKEILETDPYLTNPEHALLNEELMKAFDKLGDVYN